jgi:hypothetical protein
MAVTLNAMITASAPAVVNNAIFKSVLMVILVVSFYRKIYLARWVNISFSCSSLARIRPSRCATLRDLSAVSAFNDVTPLFLAFISAIKAGCAALYSADANV